MTLKSGGAATATISPAEYTLQGGGGGSSSFVNAGTGFTIFNVVWCASPSTQTTCTTATTKSISFTIGGSVF